MDYTEINVDNNLLLPCPFCGSPAMLTGGGTCGKSGPLPYKVMCSSRICPVHVETAPIAGKEKAINAWNTRKVVAQ